MTSFIITGFVWRILGRGPKRPLPHPRAASKKPSLNRVKSLKDGFIREGRSYFDLHAQQDAFKIEILKF